jgi:hypothetical protein
MDTGKLIEDLFAVVKKAEREAARSAAENRKRDAGLQPSLSETQSGVDPTSND